MHDRELTYSLVLPVDARQSGPRHQIYRDTHDAILAALDRNNDAQLSKQELDQLPVQLRSLDKNADGQVSRDEAGSQMRRRGRESQRGERSAGGRFSVCE